MTDILDMSDTVKSKTDQLNVDDMMGEQRTIQIERVTKTNDNDQPINIYYFGGGNIPYKPCLIMRRMIIELWGKDGNQWVGRCLNLYIDKNVSYGKQRNCGGLRINALSHVNGSGTVSLTVGRGIKQTFRFEVINLQENNQ